MFRVIFLFVAVSSIITPHLALAVPVSKESKLSKHPVVLVVSFDGFRHDYLQKAQTPNLRALQAEGVRVPYMKAQFPTKTFPNHMSIATGLYPDFHGITDNTVFDPLYDRVISGNNDDPEFWNYRDDVMPFFIRNEQGGDDRISGCYLWPGSTRGYGPNGTLYPTYALLQYDESIPFETRVDTVISWMTDVAKPANMVFLYHNEPDTHGHEFGTDSQEMVDEIEKVDMRIGYLVEKLRGEGIYESINLVIVSDHGMQNVHKEDIVDTSQIANNTLFDKYGGTPVVQIRPRNPSDLQAIYDTFKNASIGNNFTVYKKEELEYLHYSTNRRIMDLVLLPDLGYGFEDVWYSEGAEVAGIHGWSPDHDSMRGIFIARGPLFKKGFNFEKPINNLDIVPLLSQIMGVPEPPNNGSFTDISDILEPQNKHLDLLII